MRRRENTKLLLRPLSLANLPLASRKVCSFSLGLLEYHLNGRQEQAVLFMTGSRFSLRDTRSENILNPRQQCGIQNYPFLGYILY